MRGIWMNAGHRARRMAPCTAGSQLASDAANAFCSAVAVGRDMTTGSSCPFHASDPTDRGRGRGRERSDDDLSRKPIVSRTGMRPGHAFDSVARRDDAPGSPENRHVTLWGAALWLVMWPTRELAL
jgi:hypothetical protein